MFDRRAFNFFNQYSDVGMSYNDLICSIEENYYPPNSGPMGLFTARLLESKKEFIDMVDYQNLRDSSAYAIFVDKKTGNINKKLPITELWSIYDSLLEADYSDNGWREIWKRDCKFGLTNSIYISSLFDEKPKQWGLRGDPFLWNELQEKAKNIKLLSDETKMEEYLNKLFYELTGYEITTKEHHIYVNRYDKIHCGMSSGYVSPEWWKEKGFPIIMDRYKCKK